jgi:type IV secretory pathway VirB2 component (pilin)
VRENRSDDAAQWLLTFFLGPIAAILAGIVIGLLLRGSGLR